MGMKITVPHPQNKNRLSLTLHYETTRSAFNPWSRAVSIVKNKTNRDEHSEAKVPRNGTEYQELAQVLTPTMLSWGLQQVLLPLGHCISVCIICGLES